MQNFQGQIHEVHFSSAQRNIPTVYFLIRKSIETSGYTYTFRAKRDLATWIAFVFGARIWIAQIMALSGLEVSPMIRTLGDLLYSRRKRDRYSYRPYVFAHLHMRIDWWSAFPALQYHSFVLCVTHAPLYKSVLYNSDKFIILIGGFIIFPLIQFFHLEYR